MPRSRELLMSFSVVCLGINTMSFSDVKGCEVVVEDEIPKCIDMI